MLFDVLGNPLVRQCIGSGGGRGFDLPLNVDRALPPNRLAGLGEPLEDCFSLANLLLDLRRVGSGLVAGLGAVALASATSQSVFHALVHVICIMQTAKIVAKPVRAVLA